MSLSYTTNRVNMKFHISSKTPDFNPLKYLKLATSCMQEKSQRIVVIVNFKMGQIRLWNCRAQPSQAVIHGQQFIGHRHGAGCIQRDVRATAVCRHSGVHAGAARHEVVASLERVQRGTADNENFQFGQICIPTPYNKRN